MSDTKTANPYIAFAETTGTKVINGKRVQIDNQPGLSDRLRQMAYYCTENQQSAADALLVMDLHAAADELKRASFQTQWIKGGIEP